MRRATVITLASILGLLAFRAEAVTFERVVPAPVRQQMLKDLEFMGSVSGRGSSPLHLATFGAVAGKVYADWFASRVLRVGFDRDGSSGAVAYVQYTVDPNRMVLTENFTRFSHPQIARLLVVFHEARHTEASNSFWRHAHCPFPFVDDQGREIKSIWTGMPLAGEAACDMEATGAYGSSLILLANLAKFCANCNEKVKMDAELYARDQYLRITNPSAKRLIKQDLAW
jgi:hypothetical protein